MDKKHSNDRTAIIVAIIGLIGVVFATTYSSLSEYLKPKSTNIQNKNEVYDSVKIGNQIWMNRNFGSDHFRGGEHINQAKSEKEWQTFGRSGKPCWSYYQYDNTYKNVGIFYNFYAVNDPLVKLAPQGWHIPSRKEWEELIKHLGGANRSGKSLKNIEGWKDNGNGNNSSNFTAIPAGFCGNGGGFIQSGFNANWWSSTDCGGDCGIACYLKASSDTTFVEGGGKSSGFNVRLIKDLR